MKPYPPLCIIFSHFITIFFCPFLHSLALYRAQWRRHILIPYPPLCITFSHFITACFCSFLHFLALYRAQWRRHTLIPYPQLSMITFFARLPYSPALCYILSPYTTGPTDDDVTLSSLISFFFIYYYILLLSNHILPPFPTFSCAIQQGRLMTWNPILPCFFLSCLFLHSLALPPYSPALCYILLRYTTGPLPPTHDDTPLPPPFFRSFFYTPQLSLIWLHSLAQRLYFPALCYILTGPSDADTLWYPTPHYSITFFCPTTVFSRLLLHSI